MDIEDVIKGVILACIVLMVVAYIYGLIVGDEKKIAKASEAVVFDSTEDMFRHAAYAGHSGRTFDEKVKDKAAVDMINKYATASKDVRDDTEESDYRVEGEYFEEDEFLDNKEKGNFFEALVENDYVKRDWQILKDNVLDSLYKVDIVAIDNRKRNIEIVQCKYWNKDSGYIIEEDEIDNILSLNVQCLDYLKRKIGGFGKYSVHIKFLVTDYGFIDERAFVRVFDSFREEYSDMKFSFHQVNWDDEYFLKYS